VFEEFKYENIKESTLKSLCANRKYKTIWYKKSFLTYEPRRRIAGYTP